MNIQPMTAAAIAKSLLKLAGPDINIDIVREGYLSAAADLRRVAEKAEASKSGKFRSFTPDHARRCADLQARMADEVPAELAKLIR